MTYHNNGACSATCRIKYQIVSNSEFLGVPPSVNCIHFRFQTKKNKELLTIIIFHDSLPTKSCMTCLHLFLSLLTVSKIARRLIK